MEREFLQWLATKLTPHPCLRLGFGDDAAVLRLAERSDCVVTVDLLTDGVDFELSKLPDKRRIGHKAIAVNLSDLAAMAARPLAVVIALALPRTGALDLAKELYAGMLPLAEKFHIAIAGGDTNTWDGPLAISITAIGETTNRGPLLRSGAQPGDDILVTGQLGGSILGRHLDVEPRISEALLLHERYELHAGIDISDGLAIDLNRLCAASNCGAVLEAAAIPVSPAAIEFASRLADNKTPLDHALSDGEDFELLLAVKPEVATQMLAGQPLPVPLSRIGQFTAEPGMYLRDVQGNKTVLQPLGYLH